MVFFPTLISANYRICNKNYLSSPTCQNSPSHPIQQPSLSSLCIYFLYSDSNALKSVVKPKTIFYENLSKSDQKTFAKALKSFQKPQQIF